jgi:hypothetical protein
MPEVIIFVSLAGIVPAFLIASWRGGWWLVLSYSAGVALAAVVAAIMSGQAQEYYGDQQLSVRVLGQGLFLAVVAPAIGAWSGSIFRQRHQP